jgi:hypothetical protein
MRHGSIGEGSDVSLISNVSFKKVQKSSECTLVTRTHPRWKRTLGGVDRIEIRIRFGKY